METMGGGCVILNFPGSILYSYVVMGISLLITVIKQNFMITSCFNSLQLLSYER